MITVTGQIIKYIDTKTDLAAKISGNSGIITD